MTLNLLFTSFGLLHRIPPVPEDREPGAVPIELTEPEEEFGQQQLFVPADLTDDMETPEAAEERVRWENEQWERQSYARSYMHQAPNSSGSAYVSRSDSEINSRIADVARSVQAPKPKSTSPNGRSPLVHASSAVPVTTTYVSQRDPPRSLRSSPTGVPRASTPTPTSPLGYHVNGD